MGGLGGMLAISGCCFGGGASCDPNTYVAHCSGQRFSFCNHEVGYGFDFGSHLVEGDCAADEECLDLGMNQVGCALRPAQTCNPETFVGRCEGQSLIVCTAPSNLITENYVVRGSTCPANSTCAVIERNATCVPTSGPPCPLPAPQMNACVGNDVVVCTQGVGSATFESFRGICPSGCVEENGFAHCR